MSNKRLLDRYVSSKSCANTIDLGTMPNSLLPHASADMFFDMVRDSSRFLQAIREVRTTDCKGVIHRLNLGEIVTEGASATNCFSLNSPLESQLTYELAKYRSGFTVSSDLLRCNIEKERLVETLMNQFRTRIGRDLERASIMGDERLPMGQGQSKMNNLFGMNDGFLRLLGSAAPAENVIDAQGAGLSSELLFAINNRVPIDYMGDIADYKLICGPRLYNAWAQSLTSRETALGDAAILSGGLYRPLGESVFYVPNWPENLDLGGGETTGTTLVFSPLSNFIYFLGMDLTLERERVPRCDHWEYTMYTLADFMVELPEMVVVVKNVDICGEPWTGCASGYGLENHNPASLATGYERKSIEWNESFVTTPCGHSNRRRVL